VLHDETPNASRVAVGVPSNGGSEAHATSVSATIVDNSYGFTRMIRLPVQQPCF
jgi:hypothetical protein